MKQKYFIHKFTRYFFLFSLPVMIIGLLLTVYSYFQIRENSNTQAQSSFQASSQLMEEILTKGDDIAKMMNTNSAISMSMYRISNQNSMNYKEHVTKNIIFNILENLKSSSSYIDSVYVYFPNEKDYFFQTGEKLTSIQDSADQQWLRDFKEHAPDEEKWIVPRSFQNYHFEKEHSAVTIYRRIRYYGGVLVVNLDQSVLSELLSSLENYPNESIFVTNSEGRMLFSNANAEQLHFSEEQGIHEQLSLPLTDTGHYLSSVKYNSRSYVLTEFIYPDYDLHFLSLVPSRDIYRLMYNILYCVLIGCLAAAILCLLFSLYLTNKNFHQIERLLDILWCAEKGTLSLDDSGEFIDAEKLDEYNLILNQVIFTFVRNNMLTMQLKEWQLKKTISELKALQLQINPHFFFNTLQSIDMEIVKNEGYHASASRLVHALSDILRYALSDSKTSVSLKDEIQFCKEYMEIQKFHHPGQIVLLWDYDDSVLNYCVIRLLFQPLLENSIHYSIRCPSDSLVIRIKIFEKGEVLKFHILDNGVGIEKERLRQIRESLQSAEEQGHHIGMRNTHKRLVLTYPGNAGLTVVSHEGRGTCVRFEVPKEGGNKGELGGFFSNCKTSCYFP